MAPLNPYKINYTRKLAELRVPIDQGLYNKLAFNPREMFAFWKVGFNANMLKNFHVFASLWVCYALTGLTVWKLYDNDYEMAYSGNPNLAAMRYFTLSSRGDMGAYDSNTGRFQNDPKGCKDISYDW